METLVEILSNNNINQPQFCKQANNIKCNQCERIFKKRSKMVRHINETHLNLKNYNCDKCNKSFKRNYHLIRHQISHSNEKKLNCPHCIMAFNYKHHVDRHVKLVHNGELFKCENCPEQFRKRKTLAKHLKTHQQNTKSEINKVQKKKIIRKQKDYIYVCRINDCIAMFHQPYRLKLHQNKCHAQTQQQNLRKDIQQQIFLQN